jgi:hypothetical protein
MAETAIQTKPNPPEVLPEVLPVTPKKKTAGDYLFKTLKTLASLRLTVFLFVLAILLVFFGSLAQVDLGNWTAVKRYFRSAYVWVPLQIFFPRSVEVGGGFPFPGGWLLGGLLLVNLLAAHAIRFKISWKRSGILLIHVGLIVLMLSELVTGLCAVEGRLSILEGQSSNFVEDYHATELAIVDSSDPEVDRVVVVPSSMLSGGGLIQDPQLPFDVEVVRFWKNSKLYRQHSQGGLRVFPVAPPGAENLANAGVGQSTYVALERPEASGTSQDEVNFAAAYVNFKKRDSGQSLGTYLTSVEFLLLFEQPRQEVKVGDKSYQISLRFKRTYKPYNVHLLEFRHDRYLGTDIPKNFSSRVRVVDPDQGDDREVLISMNDPLRYRGETFYQASVLGADQGTVLQVVQNPGWLMPYIACSMVALGMLVHFGMHLIQFLRQFLSRRILT